MQLPIKNVLKICPRQPEILINFKEHNPTKKLAAWFSWKAVRISRSISEVIMTNKKQFVEITMARFFVK